MELFWKQITDGRLQIMAKKKKTSWISSIAVGLPVKMLGLVTIIFCLLIVFVYREMKTYAEEKAIQELVLVSEQNSLKVREYMNSSLSSAEAMNGDIIRNHSMELYDYVVGVSDSSAIRTLLEAYMDNMNIFSTYIALEPTETHVNGLSFYLYRSGGAKSTTLDFVINEDFAEYGNADYYKTSMELQKAHITAPYAYTLDNGETVTLVTVSTPLIVYGNLIGVVNCDFLASGVGEIPFSYGSYTQEEAKVAVYTGDFVYVSYTDDDSKIGTQNARAEKPEGALVKNGQQYIEHEIARKFYIIFTPITLEGSDLVWSSQFKVDEGVVLRQANTMIRKLLIIAVAAMLVLIGVVVFLFRKELAPVNKIVDYTGELSSGNLGVDMDYHVNNEFENILDGLRSMVDTWNNYISEISGSLGAISSKDLTSEIETEFVGDFAPIKTALETINGSLNDTMSQIAEAGRQVSDGAVQIANGAQNLAQGSTEQASAVEELNATVNDIYSQAEKNTEKSQEVAYAVTSAGEAINASNAKMKELTDAMEDMTNKSNEISKIVKTIEDIAFQTNILALNAAVEAARAGTAGKGFAVVADEVRNLATKSSDAASETTKLIGETISAISNGSKIASETANDLENVVAQTATAASDVREIASASEAQSSAISQVKLGIEQISVVVSTNSATSEESAAASEELSGQANVLQSLLNEFNLKK